VARLEAISDNITEERLAQIALEPLPAGLSIGEAAEVTLRLPGIASSILVPGAALKVFEGRSGVWRLDDGQLHFVAVRKGASGPDGMVQILDGLQAGDPVVVYSQKELTPQTRVRVVDALVEPQQ
jgi:HlyD family secretion protein